MPIIKLETHINSDIQICFDLSRSIDLHVISTAKTKEKAIDGRTSGLISLNEFVTWQATHFGIRQKLTSHITVFNKPFHFRDEQQKGIFKFIIHDHYFKLQNDMVIMEDVFEFQSPFGFMGHLIDRFFLISYLTKLLAERNNTIKEFAESEKWKMLINDR